MEIKKGLDPWKWDMLDVNDRLLELNEQWYGSRRAIEKRMGKTAKDRGENVAAKKQKKKA